VPIQKNKPKFIKLLENNLKLELPGEKAHDIMRTGPKLPKTAEYLTKAPIPSAVLILLFPKRDSFNFILTLRSKHVETHKGQISLPGGVQEGDESLEETALREANEEIGVLPETVEIIGELSTVYIPYSGYKIYPYVGWTNSTPNLKASAEEVEKIIFTSIPELLNNDNQRKKTTVLRGIPVTMPYYNLNNEKVWGATSMILSEFKQLIS